MCGHHSLGYTLLKRIKGAHCILEQMKYYWKLHLLVYGGLDVDSYPKLKWKNKLHADAAGMSLKQVKMMLSSGRGLHMPA